MANASGSAGLWPSPSLDSELNSDRQLLERYVKLRDEAAFAKLVERHGRLVWGVCRRYLRTQQDAEDAYQAVFLVLARKASSIRNTEAVGGWLYGVANRLALRAKQNSVRRQEREKQPRPNKMESSPQGEAACRELQRVLDEEVMRLKDKYRAPFVLCCLEGLTKAEAAKELGCKEGTVSGRLARARKILQTRLARRGFTLTAVLAALALSQDAVWAMVPAVLANTASAVLASEAGASALSSSSVSMADAYLRSARLAAISTVLAALVAALFLMVTGAGIVAVHHWTRTNITGEPALSIMDPETFLAPGKALGTAIGEEVLTVAFSPDGKRLVTAGAWSNLPGQLKVWDTDNIEEIIAKTRISGVRSAAFAPNGDAIATGDFSGNLILRDAATIEETATVKAHVGGVNSIAYSRDGEFIATAGLDRLVKTWTATSLREQKVLRGHTDKALCVAYFGHGNAIVSGSQDRTAKIWNLETGVEKFTLIGHRAGVEAVSVSPDDRFVATASTDQSVVLWDAETGEKLGALESEKTQPYLAVAFSHDGEFLAAAGRDGTIQVWEVKTRKSLGTLEKHKAPIWGLAFSKENVLASGSADRTAKLWHMRGGKKPKELTTSWSARRPVHAVAYSPDGSVLAIATSDTTVHIRDTKVGDIIRVLHGHTAPVTSLAFSSDGRTLASGSEDKTIKLWDWTSGDERRTLVGHADAVQALVFSAGGDKLFSAGDDATIRIWDPRGGKELSVLNGHEGAVRALAIAPNSETLASGGVDQMIKLWDLTKEIEVASLNGHEGAVHALAFSSNNVLASASEDWTVRIWDPATATLKQTLDGHTGEVLALAFTPKGGALVSGGWDGSVHVWDPVTGQARAALRQHNDAVTSLAMHPHGLNLVSGSLDTLLLRWRAGTIEEAPKKLAAKADAPFVLAFNDALEAQKENDLAIGAPKIAPAPKLTKEFLFNFKDKSEHPHRLELAGPEATKCVTFEADGLHVKLPTGFKGERPKTGVVTRLPLSGDFEITANIEILKEPEPEDTGKDATRISLGVDLQGATKNVINYSRRMGLSGGRAVLVAWSSRAEPRTDKDDVKVELYPSTAKPRRVRLARAGTDITFSVSEDVDTDFVVLDKRPFSDAPIREIRLSGCTASENAALAFRVDELRIRADAVAPPTIMLPPAPLTFQAPPQASQPTLPPRELPERVEIQFRKGVDGNPDLHWFGTDAAAMAKPDPQGLRFTLPAGREDLRSIGVVSQKMLRGDFEVTLAYELLSVPMPGPEYGAGAMLQVEFDTPNEGKARLTRLQKTNGATFGANYITRGPDGKEAYQGLGYPKADEKITTGRLRISRNATTLIYDVDEGGAGFRTLATKEGGGADVQAIRVMANTGLKSVPLDVRFVNLDVRSAAKAVAAPALRVSDNAPPMAVIETPASSRFWMVATLAVGFLFALLLALAVLVRPLIGRRRSVTFGGTPQKPSASVPPAPVIFFECLTCGKNLKVKAGLAGKKVKCTKCSAAVRVPERHPDEDEIPVV